MGKRRVSMEIKLCPYCGSEARVLRHSYIDNNMGNEWCVVCQNPDGVCNARIPYESTEQSAMEAWNNRPAEKELLDALIEWIKAEWMVSADWCDVGEREAFIERMETLIEKHTGKSWEDIQNDTV
jgi:Lar family restriction alleviation protein